MNLYIETENGAVKNHPAFEDNLIEAFGAVPAQWEPFTYVDRPTLGVYQTMDADEPSYAKLDGVWTDVWTARDMTAGEKAIKQQATRDAFNNRDQVENWSAWTFDETTCAMVSPIPRLELDRIKISQGIFTFWCGADNNWKDTPARPEGEYKFDFIAWVWLAT
jgi:hypothetical protein